MTDNSRQGAQETVPEHEKPSRTAEASTRPQGRHERAPVGRARAIRKAGRRLKAIAKGGWAWVVAAVSAVIIAVATAWALTAAGLSSSTPSVPGTATAVPVGHPPGSQDVSTLAAGRAFYATPNFYDDRTCGRPCQLQSWKSPTEDNASVSSGWPCEYYDPASAAEGPFCVEPPSGRTKTEMANPSQPDSGDRVLILCQVNGEPIQNEVLQRSSIWDVVAMPAKYIPKAVTTAHLVRQVPRMPGFYETYVPDIWLGNTGSHGITCRGTNAPQ
jgi:hypothetical protein